MRFPGQYSGIQMQTPDGRQAWRSQTTDYIRQRGTVQKPPPPRDVQAQSGPRGIYVTWSEPDPRNPNSSTIAGWRVYKDDEKTLYAEIKGRGTRKIFVEATAGASPPVVNIFVSSINALGKESATVQVQGSATAEAGAPSMPTPPPEYNITYAGGADRSSSTGKYAFNTQ